jgi:L-asparagine transporter-like permease
VIVSIFSYLSIEMIAVAAGEARDPQAAVVKAFRATVFRLIFFYLLTLGLMLAIVPWNATGTEGSPFVKVMQATHIPFAAGALNFVVLIAALSAMNSQLYITSRMMFSLSRAGYSPKSLGKLNSKGVPMTALIVSTGGIGLATALSVIYPATSFTIMMSLAMFGAMFTWMMIFVTHLFFRQQEGRNALKFRMWGYPYTSLLGALLMAAIMLTTLSTAEFRMTMIFGGPFLVCLSIAYFVIYRKNAATI